MEIYKLDNMIKGWFVGDFSPVVLKSAECEVSVKYYMAGDKEDLHVHKVAQEITVVVQGKVRINEKEFVKGDIIVLAPNEPAHFEALEDAVTVVVKSPSVKGDKYILAAE